MEPAVLATVAAIHASPGVAVLAATGGASQALGWLLGVPGASKTILEAVVPYSRRSFLDFVRKASKSQRAVVAPGQFASPSAARLLAQAAYNRALLLSPPGYDVVGIGFTGALATATPKRGPHRCHVAACSQQRLQEYSLHLSKSLGRSRWEEDDLSSRLLLKALAKASIGSAADELPLLGLPQAGVGRSFPEGTSSIPPEQELLLVSETELSQAQQLQSVIDGDTPLATFTGTREGEGSLEGSIFPFAREGRRVVLSGSFNPLHHGHTSLMAAALQLVPGGVPCFEIAAVNADKGQAPMQELQRRVDQFIAQGRMVVVTAEPLFAAKAELLPDSSFVIGYDTAIRLINPKYYEDSEQKMLEVLLRMGELGCDFIVAPRLVGTDFKTFDDLVFPAPISHLFKGIPGFRVDISSSEIRARLQKAV